MKDVDLIVPLKVQKIFLVGDNKEPSLFGYEVLSLKASEFPQLGRRAFTEDDDYVNFKQLLTTVTKLVTFGAFSSFNVKYFFNVNLSTFAAYGAALSHLLTNNPYKESLVIEITEKEFFDEQKFEEVISLLKKLNSEGITFCLDDFGTRDSNFDRLFSLKDVISVVKVDKVFWYHYAEALRSLMKKLSDKVFVLERVENQLDFLKASSKAKASPTKSVLLQGFYLHYPEVFHVL